MRKQDRVENMKKSSDEQLEPKSSRPESMEREQIKGSASSESEQPKLSPRKLPLPE